MKKVNLPIESSDEDYITPGRPDLGWLTKMCMVVITSLIFAIGGSYIFSHFLLSRIDLETERRYFGNMMIEEGMQPLDLKTLKVSSIREIFSGYGIYMQSSSEENAFATLGGNIIITTALFEKIENEEELIFILGHERAHIEHRDVIRSFAQSMPIILTLQSLGIDTGDSMTHVSSILSNYTSREIESKADDAGLVFLESLELNPLCATGFFERNQNGFESYTKILSDHPAYQERLLKLQNSGINKDKACTPIKTENSSD